MARTTAHSSEIEECAKKLICRHHHHHHHHRCRHRHECSAHAVTRHGQQLQSVQSSLDRSFGTKKRNQRARVWKKKIRPLFSAETDASGNTLHRKWQRWMVNANNSIQLTLNVSYCICILLNVSWILNVSYYLNNCSKADVKIWGQCQKNLRNARHNHSRDHPYNT